ncbi:MAG: CotH kinase family protein [Oscillospiraceae bacterium]|nr:CotH kinase family protein [Oscillospiraceae bacterium]
MKAFLRFSISILLIVGMILSLGACSMPFLPNKGASGPQVTPELLPTPEPTPVPTPAPTPYEVPEDLPLRISEVMPSNKASLSADGLFPDWIELHNESGEPISLRNVSLCCGTDSFELGDKELGADEYMIVFCDDSGLPDRAPFSISKEGETLALRTDRGVVLDEFELPACEADRSAFRTEDGGIVVSSMTTPGYANSPEGYELRQAALVCDSPLQISEVMVYKQFGDSPKGVGSDWVELKNVSGGDVQLSDYYLSDSAKDRLAYRLPEQLLPSGGYVLIYCDGSADGGEYAPFKLDSQREHLYLSRADETLADYVLLERIPYGYSYGRAKDSGGFFYIASPTPGAENESGLRRVAETPVLLGRDGVFDDVDAVEVVLSAPGEIHFTTDGSVPTADSPVYTEPLSFNATCVLRAISIEEGCITGKPLNLSYIINEHHTLPVVSVMSEPDEFFTRGGMYNDIGHEIEVPGAVELFEEGGSFSISCGLKLHGAVSKQVSDKRSMKLCFRSCYDGNLEYDLFGNGVTDFDSILLRHPAEDQMSTYLRDILIHDMAMKCFPALPCLDYKFVILYVDGQYWGIYAIREAFSATHYANHYGYDLDTVSSWKSLWDRQTEGGKACEFALVHDLSYEENYEYVSQHLDIDSLIGWTILQAWCANYDCNPSNVRYFYSTEDEKVHFGLSDLDLGMFTQDLFDVPLYGSVNYGFRNNYDFNVLARNVFFNRGYQLRMAEQLAAACRGAMADEAVAATLESYRKTLSPEVARDLKRWYPGMTEENAVASWNMLVDRLVEYATQYGGRSRQVIESFIGHTSPRFTQEEIDYYFGDLL